MQIDFFGAPWCDACPGQLKLWKDAAARHNHTVNYIDVDKYPEDAEEIGVRSVPTVIVGDARYQTLAPTEILRVCGSLAEKVE